MDTYTPRTDDELKSEAEKRYASTYDQKKLVAQQNYDTSDLAYQQQLKQLQDALMTNQQTLAKNTADSIASADRYTITRGMQRSSYGAANRANLQAKGQQNLAAILQQYATEASGIESNRTLLAQQLADTLAQHDIDYMNDVQAYIDEQKQLDYDRKTEADAAYNQLQMALYEYGQAAKKSSGGSSGKKSSSSSGSTGTSASKTSGSLWANLASQTVQKVYSVNPTFGTANQSTTGTLLKKTTTSTSKSKGETNRNKR